MRIAVSEKLECRQMLAAGDPDSSFGIDGTIQSPISSRIQYNDMVTLANGNILLAGGYSAKDSTKPHQYILTEYNADGTRDLNFGTKGDAFGLLGSDQISGIAQIVVESNGQILALADNLIGTPFLARFKVDGTWDTSFGKDGQIALGFEVDAVAEQSDGEIVAVGLGDAQRFNADGSPDQSFNDIVTADNAFSQVSGTAVKVLSDGIILVGTNSGNGSFDQLIELNPDGTLDTSFGSFGETGMNEAGTTNPEPGKIDQIALLNNGKFLVAGNGDEGPAIVRYNADGSVDKTFGAPGLSADVEDDNVQVNNLTVDAAGNAVVMASDVREDYVIRVTPSGALDETFGTVEAFSSVRRFFSAGGAVQSDGKLLLAGTAQIVSSNQTSSVFLMQRLSVSGSASSPIRIGSSQHVLNITGTNASDKIVASEGTPFLLATENDYGRLFETSDVRQVSITGGAGDDQITADLLTIPADISGGDGNDRITGGDKNDTLSGNAGSDRIDGNNGADLISGGGGHDQLRGQGGADHIYGGAGNDYIEGDGGNDRLAGDFGNDTIHGNGGNDTLLADDGQADSLFGDGGNDSANVDIDDVTTSIEVLH